MISGPLMPRVHRTSQCTTTDPLILLTSKGKIVQDVSHQKVFLWRPAIDHV